MVAKVRVLAVDDEPMNLDLLERSLHRHYDVLLADGPEAALELIGEHRDIALILCDYRMPGMNGAELLARSIELNPSAKRVVITGYADADNIIDAINTGQIHYLLKKPWSHQDLSRVVDQLMHIYQLETENRQLLDQLRTANDDLRAKEALLAKSLDATASDSARALRSAYTELQHVNRELELLSYKDGLTDLYSHRAFHERVDEELARARRYRQPLSLLLLDIDRFRQINNDLGYQLGDEILRATAALLRSRDGDTRLRDSDVIARFGGEEFAILLPETGKGGAGTKADRLREMIASAEFPADLEITVSVGVATFPDDAESREDLVRGAERALRRAKIKGRNQVKLYGEDEETTTGTRLDTRAAGVDVAIDMTAFDFSPPPRPRQGELFPTYHEHLAHIGKFLDNDRAVSCLYIDLSQLRRVELEYGIAKHAEVFLSAGKILDGLRGDRLRLEDTVCRTEDDDAYLCFLSAARSVESEMQPADMETIAVRIQETLETALGPEVHDLIHDNPRITVGYARVLNNSMIRPERLIHRLVTEAMDSARLMKQRTALRDKTLLQEIILTDALTPVYQPIVHLETGDVFGYEALTRGPRRSPLQSPKALFGVADEVGLTHELDRACFRGALRGAAGLEPVHRLFVNLLPMSFYDTAFIEQEVRGLLDAAALTPTSVVFEITERLAIENFGSFRRALAGYTAMGFGVAIDDVGTRHSNLESVMALRPHFIKISDVLTRGVARSTVKREMFRSLGRIAEAIDAVVVAEGIETPDDLAVLRDLGVHYGQGFFLARPGPPFPRLRASVRRAVRALAEVPREPIGAPPAEITPHMDDHGDFLDDAQPSTDVRRRVELMARGSGQHPTAAVDEDEPPEATPSGESLRNSPAGDGGASDDETGKPRT